MKTEEKQAKFLENIEENAKKEKNGVRGLKRNGSLFNEILHLRINDNAEDNLDDHNVSSLKRQTPRYSTEGINFLRIQEEIFNGNLLIYFFVIIYIILKACEFSKII